MNKCMAEIYDRKAAMLEGVVIRNKGLNLIWAKSPDLNGEASEGIGKFLQLSVHYILVPQW